MSIKIAVGSKIYELSNFSEDQTAEITELAKSLNYRVNQVISAFGLRDQELALVLAALSLLEELRTIQENASQADLFSYQSKQEGEVYTKQEVEEIVLSMISNFNNRVFETIEKCNASSEK